MKIHLYPSRWYIQLVENDGTSLKCINSFNVSGDDEWVSIPIGCGIYCIYHFISRSYLSCIDDGCLYLRKIPGSFSQWNSQSYSGKLLYYSLNQGHLLLGSLQPSTNCLPFHGGNKGYSLRYNLDTCLEKINAQFLESTTHLVGIYYNLLSNSGVIDPPSIALQYPSPSSSSVCDCYTSLLSYFASTSHNSLGDLFLHQEIQESITRWLVVNKFVVDLVRLVYGDGWVVSSFSSLRVTGSSGTVGLHQDYPYHTLTKDSTVDAIVRMTGLDPELVRSRPDIFIKAFPLGLQIIFPLSGFNSDVGGPEFIVGSQSGQFTNFPRSPVVNNWKYSETGKPPLPSEDHNPFLFIQAEACTLPIIFHAGVYHRSKLGSGSGGGGPRLSLMINIIPTGCGIPPKDDDLASQFRKLPETLSSSISECGWNFV